MCVFVCGMCVYMGVEGHFAIHVCAVFATYGSECTYNAATFSARMSEGEYLEQPWPPHFFADLEL